MSADTLTAVDVSSAMAPAMDSTESSIVCAVLMPHAPVLVPEVGGERGRAVAASSRAMRAAAARVMRQAPEIMVLISPHSPRKPGAFGIWGEDPVNGALGQFNAPHARVSLPNDASFAGSIAREAVSRGLATWLIQGHALDHGAIVPLWFLQEAGWSGPTVVLGLNHAHDLGLNKLGQSIAAAARHSRRQVAVVASGDMSHRLKPGAPCGFHHSTRRTRR